MSVKKREFLSLMYFVSRALFLGVGFSYMYRSSGKDAWIAIIIGYLLGNIFIILYDKFSKNINYNLNNIFSSSSCITNILKFIFLIIYLFIVLYMSVIFTNFVKIYYLFDTPIYLTLFMLYIVCLYASSKTEQAIIRTSFILFPISLTLIIINGILLYPLSNTINFFPILTHDSTSLLTSTLVFTVLSSFPSLLLIEYKTSLKAKLISYAFVTSSIFFVNFFITGVLGEYLITTYSYPEYMVLRRIRFLDFIENVENFASIMWYFDSFLIITLALTKARKLIPKDNQNVILSFILISMCFISYYSFSNYFSILDSFMKNGILFFLVALIFTCPILYIFTKKKI
ncbi:MAG: GerAB/ArcD/ProY family transporter [bacterium]